MSISGGTINGISDSYNTNTAIVEWKSILAGLVARRGRIHRDEKMTVLGKEKLFVSEGETGNEGKFNKTSDIKATTRVPSKKTKQWQMYSHDSNKLKQIENQCSIFKPKWCVAKILLSENCKASSKKGPSLEIARFFRNYSFPSILES